MICRKLFRMVAFGVVVSALALLGAPTALAAKEAPQVFAVVVGHNDGWGVLPQLRYADDDALRFYRLAVQLAPRQNVALLTELDVQTWQRLQASGTTPPPYLPPTKRRLKEVISLFKGRIAKARKAHPKRPVHLYFFFSGHGEKGYFLLKRKSKQAAEESAFTARDLRHAFSGSQATLNGLFIDACKSQSLFVAKGPKDKELGPDFSGLIKKVDRAAEKLPIGVLTSTMSDRPAGEARDIGGGYFSHVLISGLAGAADADSDGTVRYGELAAFVSFHTRRISGQQPWFRPPRGKLQTSLVRLKDRADLLEIPPGIGGHFAIFDAKNGTLRVEVHKTAVQWTRLILEPGDYKVVWVRSRSFGLLARVKKQTNKALRLMKPSFVSQISLASVGMKKGGDLDHRSPAQLVESFDPAQSGFDQPFTSRVVDMLQVAYSSGRSSVTPVFRRSQRRSGASRHLLTFGYAYFGSIAAPYEHGHGLTLGYARRFSVSTHGDIYLGARGAYASSSHTRQDSKTEFSMHRVMLQAEGGYQYRFGSRLLLGAGLYAGWQLVLLLEDVLQSGEQQRLGSTLYGDALSFRLGASAFAALRVVGNLWTHVAGGFGFDALRANDAQNNGTLNVFGRPHLIVGMGYAF
jgi:hypothetical protein